MIIQQGIEVTLLKNCWSCTDAYGRVVNGKPAMQEDDGTCSICSRCTDGTDAARRRSHGTADAGGRDDDEEAQMIHYIIARRDFNEHIIRHWNKTAQGIGTGLGVTARR
jgi:hypothetical protein